MTYSINGELIAETQENACNLISPTIVRDSNFNNYFAYFRGKDSCLVIRQLPGLEARVITHRHQVSTMGVAENQQFAILGTEDGKLSLLFDPSCAAIIN